MADDDLSTQRAKSPLLSDESVQNRWIPVYALLRYVWWWSIGETYDLDLAVWMVIGMIGAFLFILIQLILIVDFAHAWNEKWVENYEESQSRGWYYGRWLWWVFLSHNQNSLIAVTTKNFGLLADSGWIKAWFCWYQTWLRIGSPRFTGPTCIVCVPRTSKFHRDFKSIDRICCLSPWWPLLGLLSWRPLFDTLRPETNGWLFADNICKYVFFNGNIWIVNKISLKYIS